MVGVIMSYDISYNKMVKPRIAEQMAPYDVTGDKKVRRRVEQAKGFLT